MVVSPTQRLWIFIAVFAAGCSLYYWRYGLSTAFDEFQATLLALLAGTFLAILYSARLLTEPSS